ncbi:hypothetical protein [Curvivirga sp.]|uniref:hypothetical protein n=1 Tax=Curvivirga sp. TaxID=2856848 RepID=UPI003B5BFFE3
MRLFKMVFGWLLCMILGYLAVTFLTEQEAIAGILMALAAFSVNPYVHDKMVLKQQEDGKKPMHYMLNLFSAAVIAAISIVLVAS